MGYLLLIATVFFFIYGVNTLLGKGKSFTTQTTKNTTCPTTSVKTPRELANDIDDDLVTLFNFFNLEGFDKEADPPEFHYHRVISGMLEKLDEEHPLEWILPNYEIRVVAVDENFPPVFQSTYTHACIVNGHVVGFKRRSYQI